MASRYLIPWKKRNCAMEKWTDWAEKSCIMNAHTILDDKGGGVRSIVPDALVFTALETMTDTRWEP